MYGIILLLIYYLILTMLEQLLLLSNSPIKGILRLQTNTKL